MRVTRILSALCSLSLVLLMSACGGGGSDPKPTAIHVTPTSLTFTAVRGQAVPAAQDLSFTYQGDGFIVGYPTGMLPPTWTTPALVSSTSSTGVLRVPITDTSLAAGTYTTTLRFIAGNEDGSGLVQQDVPVTYVITTLPQAGEAPGTAMSAMSEAPAADAHAKLPILHNLPFTPESIQPAN